MRSVCPCPLTPPEALFHTDEYPNLPTWMRFARQQEWAQRGGAAQVDQTAHVLVLVIAALYLAV